MKERIEITNEWRKTEKKNGTSRWICYTSFYLRCDLGRLFLHEWEGSKSVTAYFQNGRAPSELFNHAYGSNKRLNHIVDRLPAYISYVKTLYGPEEAAVPARGRQRPRRAAAMEER